MPNLRLLLRLLLSLLLGVLIGVVVVLAIDRWLRTNEFGLPPYDGTGDDTAACGEFKPFDWDSNDTFSENGIDADLGFAFKERASGCTTKCSTAFIQIVRTLDLDDPKRFYFPTYQKMQRATLDGWYVDRGDGYEWVYFGRRNGNEVEFHDYVKPGSELVPAKLSDRPYRPENHPFLGIRWQAVTAAVCLDGEYQPAAHGYYAWSWTVTKQGKVERVRSQLAKASLKLAFEAALKRWNDQTEDWGTKPYPLKLTRR